MSIIESIYSMLTGRGQRYSLVLIIMVSTIVLLALASCHGGNNNLVGILVAEGLYGNK